MNTLIISSTYLKDNSTTNLNVDDKLLKNAILDTQSINLFGTIGSVLYKKIIQLIDDNTLSANPNYQTLVDDYIVPYLLHWSIIRALDNIRYKVSNKSINLQSSDNATPVEYPEYKNLVSNKTNDGEFFKARLVGYLEENYKLFPEYKCTSRTDEMSPDRETYFSGIVF